MGFLASLLSSLIIGFFKAWFATHEAEQRGADKQAIDTERQANVAIGNARQASDSVPVLTADDVQNIKPGTDPDFRD